MRVAGVVLLVALCGAIGGAEGIAWHQSFEGAVTAAGESRRPVLVVFSSGGDCGWCTFMATETLVAEEVLVALGDFEPVQVNGLQRDDLATRYMVALYPTVLFLAPGGEVLEKVSGYLPPEAFAGVMQGALEANAALQRAQALEAAVRGGEATPAQMLEIAREYRAANSFRKAADWARTALAAGDAPVRPEALLILGRALVALDEPGEAIEPLKSYVTDYPEHEGIWVGKLYLGYAYVMTNHGDLGRPFLEEVAASAPEDTTQRTDALRLLEWLDAQG